MFFCATSRAHRDRSEIAQYLVHDGEQISPHLSQRYRSRAAIEESHAQGFLELVDLGAQCRLRGVERLGGLGETPEMADRDESAQLTEVYIHRKSRFL